MFKVSNATERATMLREAGSLRSADGVFADDAARKEFDARMEAIDAYDKKVASEESVRSATEAATAAERARVTGINDACRVAKIDSAVAADMVARGLTLDQARAAIFTELAKRTDDVKTDQHVVMGEDTRDKFVRGVTNWLLVKSGAAKLVANHDKQPIADPGEFRGLTLLDIARECLQRAGVSARGLDKMAIVSRAFTLRAITQSTSDFTYALENTMHKVLQAAYATQPDTWSKWCARGTVSDFRAHNRYRMGSFGSLDAVAEGGEFKHKAITDAEKATITASTKGNIINVSRQMIVNDDMGAFAGLLTSLGRAAGLSIEVDAYALLAENAGLGPTFNGSPVFDASHANIGSQAALSAAAIDADAALMARQKDKDGNDFLDLQPAVLLVERALKGTAQTINEAQYDPDTANKLQKPNVVRGLFRDVVGTPRFASAATRRYLFADPAVAPVFEVVFLEGQESPVLESKDGWNTDGAEMKVRFDYGVGAVDYRGAVTNAG
jgi:phage major head subunit gpT-like protein